MPDRDITMSKILKRLSSTITISLKFDVLELKSPTSAILFVLDEKVNISSSISVKASSEEYFEYSGGIYIQPIRI